MPSPPAVPAAPATIKLLISSGNHLGHQSRHPIRSADSFLAFEELLLLAHTNAVDAVLLTGNLFDTRRPSHATLARASALLHAHHTRTSSAPSLHIKPPLPVPVPVPVPVFALPGSRDAAPLHTPGPLDLLAADASLTLLAAPPALHRAPLEISPVLLRKGSAALALYALPHIPEITLRRAIDAGRIRFHRPPPPTHWFCLLALHQHRAAAHDHAVPDALLVPPWMDYVAWGGEPESRTEFVLPTPVIVQPGSTVPTSLADIDTGTKKVVLLEVGLEKLSQCPIPLRTAREMHVEGLPLPSVVGEAGRAEQRLVPFLEDKINAIIAEREEIFDKKLASIRDGTSEDTVKVKNVDTYEEKARYPPRSFYMDKLSENLRRPLVHLRIYCGEAEDQPNPRKFGLQFENKVASPHELISFRRVQRRSTSRARRLVEGNELGPMRGIGENGGVSSLGAEPDEQDVVGMPELVQYFLLHGEVGGKGFKVLELDKLSISVDKFIAGSNDDAISVHVKDFLQEQQQKAGNEMIAAGDIFERNVLLEKFQTGAREAANRCVSNNQSHQNRGTTPVMALNESNNVAANEDVTMSDPQGVPEPSAVATQSIEERLQHVHAMISKDPKLAVVLSNRLRPKATESKVKPERSSRKRSSSRNRTKNVQACGAGRTRAPGELQNVSADPRSLSVSGLGNDPRSSLEPAGKSSNDGTKVQVIILDDDTEDAAEATKLKNPAVVDVDAEDGLDENRTVPKTVIEDEEDEDRIEPGPAPSRKGSKHGMAKRSSYTVSDYITVPPTQPRRVLLRQSERKRVPSFKTREAANTEFSHMPRVPRKRRATDDAEGASSPKMPARNSSGAPTRHRERDRTEASDVPGEVTCKNSGRGGGHSSEMADLRPTELGTSSSVPGPGDEKPGEKEVDATVKSRLKELKKPVPSPRSVPAPTEAYRIPKKREPQSSQSMGSTLRPVGNVAKSSPKATGGTGLRSRPKVDLPQAGRRTRDSQGGGGVARNNLTAPAGEGIGRSPVRLGNTGQSPRGAPRAGGTGQGVRNAWRSSRTGRFEAQSSPFMPTSGSRSARRGFQPRVFQPNFDSRRR